MEKVIENLANELVGMWTDALGTLAFIDTIEADLNRLMPGVNWYFVYDDPKRDLAIKVVP